MPDDERLGGTRDPHEYGRRHRREAPPQPDQPQDEQQPRRRRRSVESGGVSVADLVQRHTGSRPDLTPVPPDQLRQNAVQPGRRARQDDQPPVPPVPPSPPPRPAPAPPQPSIAAALDGVGAPPARPSRPQPAPHDEASPRPGGTSSYFTIPSDAIRDSFSSEPAPADTETPSATPDLIPPDGGFAPTEVPAPTNISRPRRPRPDRNGFPRDEGRRVGETSAQFLARRPGDASAQHAAPGFPPDAGAPPRKGNRRVRGSATPAPPEGFPAETPNAFAPGQEPRPRRAGEASGPRRGRRPADAPPNGFTPDDAGFPQEGFGGARRPGEASAHYPADAFPPDENGFPQDPEAGRPGGPRRGRRASAFPPDAAAPSQGGAGPYPGFVPDTEPPHRNGTHRAGETSAHFGAPGDAGFPQETPGPNGSRHFGAPREEPHGALGRRRAGEASAHFGTPADAGDAPHGFPHDAPGRNGNRRPGEASAHFGDTGDEPHGFPHDPPGRNGKRRAGEAHFGVPGEDPRPVGEDSGPRPRRNGVRRGGEASFGTPGDDPRQAGEGPHGAPGHRRPGDASAHFGVPGDAGDDPHGRNGVRQEGVGPHGFPHEGPGPRRVGEPPFPGEGSGPRGLPPEGRGGQPEGAVRRRAARAGEPQQEQGPRPGRFPTDNPPLPQPGQASGRFPVDEGFPRDEPVESPAPEARPRRNTGVPPVPPPVPPRGDDDLVSMTTEMEAIGEEVQKRRSIDHTLARFSAVHDEIKAEEREKKAKRRKLMPWQNDDEMDRLDELEAQQSMAMAIPNLDPKDEEEDEQKAKKKRRWRKGKYAGKAFTIVVAGLVFMSTAVLWGFKSYIESSAQTVDALDPDSDAIKDAAAQTGDENFLLVGSDTRAGAEAEEGVGNEQQVKGARSDTIMVAHIPKNRERVVVVSFPRDLEVSRPACEGWDSKTGKYTGEQHATEKRVKINTAYQLGGPKCVTKTVQEISGLAINHFVGIDFHGFKDMVDAVQGVEVCVERPLDDEELGMVVPEAGKNVKLSGDQALNFVRARKVKGDPTSDYGRIIRQQRFLSSLLRKAMSTEMLLNPGKLTKFVDAFSKATFGDNIGIDQLFTLGQSMQGVEAGRVTFITVPTVGEANKRGNEELRTEDTNALFEAIRQDTPLPGEAPKNQGDTSTQAQQRTGLMLGQPAGQVDPKTVKLQVLNGGNETGGIARDTADELTELGFEVVRVGEADPVNTTVIKYSQSRAAQAKTVQAAVPGATLVEDPSTGGAIMLVIGPEFDGKVQSPTGGGTKAEVPENLSTVNAGDVSCA